MFEHRKATPEDLEILWNDNIARNPDDPRWPRWKKEYIGYNRSGKAVTFAVLWSGNPVGEGTLLFSPDCSAVRGRTDLADGTRVCNLNALRIRKEYEGQGAVSATVREMERYAQALGYSEITVGVEARETRNLAIYLHWGYGRLVRSETEGGELVLYYAKKLQESGRTKNGK